MVHYISFLPHLRPADDTSLYTFVYKCIHPGIIHRTKIKSKYNEVQQSRSHTEYKIWVPIQDSRNTQEGSPCDILQRLKTVN